MRMLYLLISNFEYIGLLLAVMSLISNIVITEDKKRWTLSGVLLGVVSCGSAYVHDMDAILCIFIFMLVILAKILIVNLQIRMMIDAILSVALISISTQLLKMIIFVTMALWRNDIIDDLASIIAQFILFFVIVGLYRFIQCRHPAELRNIPFKYIVIFMVVLAADCISLTYWGESILEELHKSNIGLIILAYVLMGLGVFAQLGLLIALYFSRNAYRTQQALATKYLEEQVAHYQYLSEREQNTKRFRHDFKSHMAMAKQLYEEGKREEFEAYFHKMTEQIAAIGNRVTVNNDIADAIINRYYDEAALAGITMEVEGHFPGECYVSAYDLCTVLSNLLSNAIDAEKEAGGKSIYCGVRYDETQILIVVKNDYVNPIKRTDNRFVSTKGDLRHQGFGIANINEVVRKNNGHIFYDTADARFVVRLSLCNMKQNS